MIPPRVGASRYSQKLAKLPAAISRPSARTGLTAPPVMGPPIRTALTSAKPMLMLAVAPEARRSLVTAMMTKTSRKVMSASTPGGAPPSGSDPPSAWAEA